MLAALAAHFDAMEQARLEGNVRTVPGRAYPLNEAALMRWEAQQREHRRQHAARALKRISPRLIAEKAFA